MDSYTFHWNVMIMTPYTPADGSGNGLTSQLQHILIWIVEDKWNILWII